MINGQFYHIFNHGNGTDDIFIDAKCYEIFYSKLKRFIDPVAEIKAYCLLKNHFHLLVKTRCREELFSDLISSVEEDFRREMRDRHPRLTRKLLSPELHLNQKFSDLFNSYSQTFNRRMGRKGCLFLRGYKRILIKNDDYLKNVLLYIHFNAVKHEMVKEIDNWPWCSVWEYKAKESRLVKGKWEMMEKFGGEREFWEAHQEYKKTLTGLNLDRNTIIETISIL